MASRYVRGIWVLSGTGLSCLFALPLSFVSNFLGMTLHGTNIRSLRTAYVSAQRPNGLLLGAELGCQESKPVTNWPAAVIEAP
jgi:hypothetical protein